jgi:hypothetical protein
MIVFEYAWSRIGIWAGLLILGVALAGLIAYGVRLRKANKPQRIVTREELSPMHNGSRLSAEGKVVELSHLADIEDVPFEPIIVERQLAASSLVFVMFLGIVVGFVLQCGFSEYFQRHVSFTGAAHMIGLTLVWIPARLRPLYYRLIPGRMDILRFSVLTGNARLIDQFDLRQAIVKVSFAKQRAELQIRNGQSEEIRLWGLAEPYRFARGILQAAICTHPAPPLPENQLLG